MKQINARIWRDRDILGLVAGITAVGIFLGVCLCCVVLLISHAEADEMVCTRWVLCQPDSEVLIRARPDRRSEVVGAACCGEQLRSDGRERNGYIHLVDVNNETGEGWISVKFIAYTEPVRMEVQAVVKSRGRVACRESVDGKRTRWAKPGQTVTVYVEADGWSVTDRGYIMSEYLEVP